MHEDAKWRPNASYALTCPPFATSISGEEDRSMSFEEQLAARSEAEVQSPTPEVLRERPVRPTPFVRRELAVRSAAKMSAADFPTQRAPSRELVLPQLSVFEPMQRSNEIKACNALGSLMCEHASKNFGESVCRSQGAKSVVQCGKESSTQDLMQASYSSMHTRDTLEGLPFLGEFARSFDMLPELEPDI
eukprot:TRINITY_DN5036_c0_g3_i2.p1 TRINITY_DN5036_c0_g3~~TRINITY_DN5036_c0_g3_i2.p1  ORF type:complete len:190 (+),score=26.10 TRINITY_DN5036_c0_g3_i2:1-570(+)